MTESHRSQSEIDAAVSVENGRTEPPDRYAQEIDLESGSTHAHVVQLVGSDKRVLELGPASGHMSRVLRDRGCTVVGIEVDPELASLATRHCERVIVGDLDTLDLEAELGSDRFDVVVAADVLEHLKDPLSALRRLRGFLTQTGYFVISLPNVAHGSVRLALLEGHFSYQDTGLLDQTHLRFFTRESIDQLLDEAELGVAEIYRQELNIDASEVPFDRRGVPSEILQALSRDPEARTYQFVLKALPMERPGLREIQRRLRDSAHEIAKLRAEQAEKPEAAEISHLQEALAALASREGELRSALINAHDQLLRRDEELHRLRVELEQVKQAAEGELAAQRELVLRLRVRLDRLLNSPPARAYALLRSLPGLRALTPDRRAGYDQALRRAKSMTDENQ